MHKILAFFSFFLGVLMLSANVMAAPPLTDDMTRLRVYSAPQPLPEVMMWGPHGTIPYLSDFKGKLILLNLWATWCPPCIDELPSIDALQGARGNTQFQVVALSLDNGGIRPVTHYLRDNGLNHLKPYLERMGSSSELNMVMGLPTSLLINPRGELIALYQGDTDWNKPAVHAVLDYYLNEYADELDVDEYGVDGLGDAVMMDNGAGLSN